MSTINGYDVIYHYENGGKCSGQHDHLRVAASASDNATIISAVKNSAQYKAGLGTIIIDHVKMIADTLQQ